MGYFEGLTNGIFKKSTNGTRVFFPWSVFGKGRVLPDERTETNIRAFVSRYYKVSLPMIIGVGVIAGWVWAFLFAFVFGAWYYFGSKSLLSGCPYSQDRLTLREFYSSSAGGHNKFTLWFLFICSVLFVLAGIYIANTAKSSGEVILGLSSILFFGAGGAGIAYMLKVKRA